MDNLFVATSSQPYAPSTPFYDFVCAFVFSPAVNSMLHPSFFLTLWSTERSHSAPAPAKLDSNLSWNWLHWVRGPEHTDSECLRWNIWAFFLHLLHVFSSPLLPHWLHSSSVIVILSKRRFEPGPESDDHSAVSTLDVALCWDQSWGCRICRRSISNCCRLLCQQNLCSHLQTYSNSGQQVPVVKRMYSSTGPL